MLFKPSEACLVYHSADLERSARFYTDVFGIGFERRGEGRGQFLFARLSADFSISIVPGQPQPGTSPLVTFTLAEGGIADVVAALAERGATIVSPVSDAPDGKGAAFLDPDGHPLGLYQPADKPLSRMEAVK
ncbi:VOC family protein [uncultured Devosia sp.]|uniref:VOC family protein n=1 Tax=uncultured Devosia sp. TaxID=211434 RepID=UPI0026253F5B|nr:VOC family protein [uncultured Devosia sp.]